MTETNNLLSVAEAATRLGLTRQAITAAINGKRLQGVRIGHMWTVTEESVAAFTRRPYPAAGQPKRRPRKEQAEQRVSNDTRMEEAGIEQVQTP